MLQSSCVASCPSVELLRLLQVSNYALVFLTSRHAECKALALMHMISRRYAALHADRDQRRNLTCSGLHIYIYGIHIYIYMYARSTLVYVLLCSFIISCSRTFFT